MKEKTIEILMKYFGCGPEYAKNCALEIESLKKEREETHECKVEKYSPRWLLEKIIQYGNSGKSLLYILDFQNNITEIEGNWINVNDRLPEVSRQKGDHLSSDNVLIYLDGERVISNYLKELSTGNKKWLFDDEPTHWKFLCPPPIEKEALHEVAKQAVGGAIIEKEEKDKREGEKT